MLCSYHLWTEKQIFESWRVQILSVDAVAILLVIKTFYKQIIIGIIKQEAMKDRLFQFYFSNYGAFHHIYYANTAVIARSYSQPKVHIYGDAVYPRIMRNYFLLVNKLRLECIHRSCRVQSRIQFISKLPDDNFSIYRTCY